MDDGKRWVTLKDGRRILINDYMNDKIRSKSKKENEKIYYHTSNHNFNEFDNEMPRKAILGGQYGYGHYFFDDKEISDGYGAYSKYQYQAKVNVKNWFKSNEKDFNGNIRKLGYNPEKDDVANFLSKKGYGGSIIEHTNANGKKWYEYVVYDGKNIKIINKKEQK